VKRKDLAVGLMLLLAGLLIGLLLGLGLGSSAQPTAGPAGSDPGQVRLTIERLEAQQQGLKAALADYRQQLAQRQAAASEQTDQLQALERELERQRLLAGLVPLQGPGVLVTLDDAHLQVPDGADPNAYLIHEYDLRDIVNLLWMAGSEAIAINDERLVSTSSIYCVGSTVMVNDTRLSPPYLIRAIGNPRVQQQYLDNPSYLQGLKEKRSQLGLRFEAADQSLMSVPSFSGGFLVQHARVGD
jgi:uncharacterized protein YlxW (UPF0749 family)